MKIAVISCMHNENRFMEKWLKYYYPLADKVFIINHRSDDGTFEKFKKIYDFEEHHLEGPISDMCTGSIMTKKIEELTREVVSNNNFVLIADADEFFVADPDKYLNWREMVEKINYKNYSIYTSYQMCNVMHTTGEDDINWEKPLLSQRKYWAINPIDRKVILVNQPLEHNTGQHSWLFNIDISPYFNNDAIIIHLKSIDRYSKRNNQQQKIISPDNCQLIPEKYKGVVI